MKHHLALLGAALAVTPAAAQTDYRNPDRGRPLAVEDAYPIERYGFELSGGYRAAHRAGDRAGHLFDAGISWGVARGTSLSLSAPFVARSPSAGAPTGLAGLESSLLANLSAERPGLPGLGLRLDAILPVGSAGPSGVAGGVTLLGTMSIGRSRVNLNAGAAVFRPDRQAEAEPAALWHAGVQLDRTLIRSSTLVAAELVVRREAPGAAVEAVPAVGMRRQLSPTVVLDAGLQAALAAGRRAETSLTVGFSHLFAVRALMPGGIR